MDSVSRAARLTDKATAKREMAGDWISDLAEAAKTHDRMLLKREHSRAQVAQVIAANSQRFWDGLLATVEADVLRFQHEFAHDPNGSLILEKFPTGFRVVRPSLPDVSLHVHLDVSGEAIEFQYRTDAGGKPAVSEWSGTLTFRVNTNGTLYLNQYGRDFMNFEELSRMFLERVFKGALR
jgi:hypothetical protein